MSTRKTIKVKNSILFAVIICLLLAIVGGTYSRYSSSGTATATAEIAKWHIELNGQDISSTSTSVNIPAQTVEGISNANVAEGKLAPGQTLVAELLVDPSGSEVAVDYIIETGEITQTNFDTDSEIKVSKIGATVEGDNTEKFAVYADGKYTFYQDLNDVLANKSVTFKIYVTWEDGDNVADTTNGTSITNLVVPVNVVARQHIESDGYVVESQDLDELFASGNVTEGSKVLLTESIDYSSSYANNERHPVEIPDNVTLDLQGKTITSNNSSVVYTGNNLKITNGNFSTPQTHSYAFALGTSTQTSGNTLSNLTVEGGVHLFRTSVTLENVTANAHQFYAVWGDRDTNITINSGTYTVASSSSSTALLGMVKMFEGSNVNENGSFIINGGTFNTNGKKLCLDTVKSGVQQYILPVIYGGTFDCDVSKYVADGYVCTNNGNGTYTVELDG